VLKSAAGQHVVTSGHFGFVQGANRARVIMPPARGIQATMPSGISRNSTSGRGIGKAEGGECAV